MNNERKIPVKLKQILDRLDNVIEKGNGGYKTSVYTRRRWAYLMSLCQL